MTDDDKPAKPRVPMQTQKATNKADVQLSREIQIKIGQQLRAMYDGVVKEGVPDRFDELLRRLDASNGKDSEGNGKDGQGATEKGSTG